MAWITPREDRRAGGKSKKEGQDIDMTGSARNALRTPVYKDAPASRNVQGPLAHKIYLRKVLHFGKSYVKLKLRWGERGEKENAKTPTLVYSFWRERGVLPWIHFCEP